MELEILKWVAIGAMSVPIAIFVFILTVAIICGVLLGLYWVAIWLFFKINYLTNHGK